MLICRNQMYMDDEKPLSKMIDIREGWPTYEFSTEIADNRWKIWMVKNKDGVEYLIYISFEWYVWFNA